MEKSEALKIVQREYPNARTTTDAVDKLFDVLKEHLNIDPHHIMHADSICSDDVNAIEYPQRAYEMLGPFKMGGLNGFPFTGLTGMNAFAHHVPEHGAVFVFYAPHIGITRKGTIGEIFRIGQHKPSACCGAAKAALNKLLNNEIERDKITELDYQQNTIEQLFYREADRIRKAASPLKEATEVMYEAIEERINTLAKQTSYVCRYVVLGGGILINGDHDMGSFCSYRRLDAVDLRSRTTRPLLRYMY